MNRNVLPERMKEIRESMGLKQGEMAEKVGIARTSLCLYENGQRTPDAHVLKQFILASGASPYYLLGLHDTKKDEYADIFQELGLSEHAIDKLRKKHPFSHVLSLMLESDVFWTVVRLIDIMAEFDNPLNGGAETGLFWGTIETGLSINYEDACRYYCQKHMESVIDKIVATLKHEHECEYFSQEDE